MAGNNRMVEKSKKAIKDALLEIMYEKDFNSITVNELLRKANVSRGTFYAHFSNLEDVREHLIDDLYLHADAIFADYTPSELAKDPYPVLLSAAEIMLSSADPAKRIFKFINVYDLGERLKSWLTKFILEDEAFVQKIGGYESAKFYARFISGGIMHTYNTWIFEDFNGSAEQLADCINKILMGGLNALLSED